MWLVQHVWDSDGELGDGDCSFSVVVVEYGAGGEVMVGEDYCCGVVVFLSSQKEWQPFPFRGIGS